ncbi:MAG TPA: ferrochelatase, partial [Jatrophihabitans sp.]|nr:ferrochelatase [Jatrophihabitans sp.]
MSFDAFLLLSFGGPQGPGEVLPFLRKVTAGRGVPDDRLAEVAEHYLHFGGVSPITAQNEALLAALAAEFGRRGITLPLYFGNRNWHPLLADTTRRMVADGRRHALVLTTSATGSYSGCRQYREDLQRALDELVEQPPPLRFTKLRHYFDHPGFIAANAGAVR